MFASIYNYYGLSNLSIIPETCQWLRTVTLEPTNPETNQATNEP